MTGIHRKLADIRAYFDESPQEEEKFDYEEALTRMKYSRQNCGNQ